MWTALRMFLEQRLAALRAQNDIVSKDATETAFLRGQIAELKALLALGEQPREPVPD